MTTNTGTTTLDRLSYLPQAYSSLRLIGNVKTILDAQCAVEVLHRVMHPAYALGGAAVGMDATEALEHLGEFICVGGRPVWTPAGTNHFTPLMEPKDSVIHTPFLIDWNGVV